MNSREPEFDKSWDALLHPGRAEAYFADCSAVPAVGPEYSADASWFLCECARLVYRQESDELGGAASGPTRSEILSAVGLREILFLNREGTQAAVWEPVAGEGPGILVFRGTQDVGDWVTNLDAVFCDHPTAGRVHKGFDSALETVWGDLQSCLRGLKRPLLYSGHSLGGALAVAAAGRDPELPAAVYTYGAPRVGDSDFCELLARLPVFRIVNNSDIVAALPPSQVGFWHAGELHYLDSNGEMLLNPPASLLRKNRALAFFDLKDLAARLKSVDPHKIFYEHAPINYSLRLEILS